MNLKVQETPTGREWNITLTEREALHLARSGLLVQCAAEKVPYEALILTMKHLPGFCKQMAQSAGAKPDYILLQIAMLIFDERVRVGTPQQASDFEWMETEMNHKKDQP